MTGSGDGHAHERAGADRHATVANAAWVSARLSIADPPATTPYDVVLETGLLRLRRYRPSARRRGAPPVLLIHSLLKRPYVLDLVPGRSVVGSLLREGFSVYLTDWLPPAQEDSRRGLQDYVECDLAAAIELIRREERALGVALVGCCLGGALAAVYTALHPDDVQRLVVLALPFESRPPFVPAAAEYVARSYGNVPAWWLRAGLNARVSEPRLVPGYLAAELGEPQLAASQATEEALALRHAFQRWLESDVAFAGQLFTDLMAQAYGRGLFAANRLTVGGRRVALERIRCPVLSVCAEHDRVVPVEESAGFVRRVGSREASSLVVPGGHLALMLSRSAHERLWPQIARWIGGDVDTGAPGGCG